MYKSGWKLIYEDQAILVVCKDPGIPTQSSSLRVMDLVSRLRNYRCSRGEEAEIYLIHRLDQPVGGLLVFGKNKKAAADLSHQVQNAVMEKYYKAVVQGEIEEEGQLKDCLLQDRKTNSSKVVESGTPGGKQAVLHFRRLQSGKEEDGKEKDGKEMNQIHLIEIRLETGRHHQIRVQLSHHGCPIRGDHKYNPDCKKQEFPALFAWKLIFYHPVTGELMEFQENPEYGYFSMFV